MQQQQLQQQQLQQQQQQLQQQQIIRAQQALQQQQAQQQQAQQQQQQLQMLRLQQLQQQQRQQQAFQALQLQQGLPNQTQAAIVQSQLPNQAMVQRQAAPLAGTQLQMVRGPNGQVIMQQPGQLLAAAGMQGSDQAALQASQLGSMAQAATVRPGAGIQSVPQGQQRMIYAGNVVANNMQIRPGFPGQGTDLIAAAAAQQQQQQQQQRKLYEAQLMRQQQQQQQQHQQDPSRQMLVQKAVGVFLFLFNTHDGGYEAKFFKSSSIVETS